MEHGIVYWIQIGLLFGIPAFIIIRILYLFLHDIIIYHKIAKQNYKNLYFENAAKDVAIKEFKAFLFFVLISLAISAVVCLLTHNNSIFIGVLLICLMYLPGLFNNKIINRLDSKNKRHYKVFFAEHIKDNLMLRYTNPYTGEVLITPLAEIIVEIIYIGAGFIQFIAYYPMFMFRIILWIMESFHDNHKMSFYIIERTEIRGTLISFIISAWFIWQHKDIFLPWI